MTIEIKVIPPKVLHVYRPDGKKAQNLSIQSIKNEREILLFIHKDGNVKQYGYITDNYEYNKARAIASAIFKVGR